MKSQNHGIRGGATDEAFQEQRFLWERGASVGVEFHFFLTFKISHTHKKNIKRGRKGKELQA